MTGRPRVALVVDHPQRDLPGLVLVAHRLAQEGVEVALVPLNLLTAEVFSLVPDFVLLNYLRRNIEPVLRGCVAAGIPYGVLDTEGGFYGDLGAYGATFTQDASLRDAVRLACVWGERTREYLHQEQLVPRDALVLTGVPRFDFYAPQWHDVVARDDARLRGRELVLFNTKIAVANPSHHSVDEEIRLYVEKLGLPLADVLRHRDIGFASIDATVELSNRLARDERDLAFVIRPHPHERLDTYEQRIDPALDNLHVIREGTVDGWIARSTALVHRQCTTAIEAMLAGVPALVPTWVPTSADAPDTEAVSVPCHTYDELREVLRAIRAGEDVVPDAARKELAKIVDDWLYAVDGRSNERVAGAVLDALPRPGVANRRAARAAFFRSGDPALSARGLVGRAARLGSSTGVASRQWAAATHPAAARWPSTPKAFTIGEVRACLDAIAATEGTAQDASPSAVDAVDAVDAGAYAWGYQGRSVLVVPGVAS